MIYINMLVLTFVSAMSLVLPPISALPLITMLISLAGFNLIIGNLKGFQHLIVVGLCFSVGDVNHG